MNKISLGLICVEDDKVKKALETMGEVLTSDDADTLMGLSFSSDELFYCPIILCEKNSPMYKRLESNNWVDESGHRYGLIKEVQF